MAQSSSKNGGSRDGKVSARELTLAAKETVKDLTGFPPESVTGLQWDGENWLVTVDVCELERIPNTTDVMATYEVQLDEQGELVGYKRSRRFQRGHAGEG
jgi:Gas vesicle synthesis protein GvpO